MNKNEESKDTDALQASFRWIIYCCVDRLIHDKQTNERKVNGEKWNHNILWHITNIIYKCQMFWCVGINMMDIEKSKSHCSVYCFMQ